MTTLLLLFLLARPDPRLTPGVVRPLTVDVICATNWRTDRRHVTLKMKREIAASYGVPWAFRDQYEFDHLIPRSLGGADDVKNIWLQPLIEAKQKDKIEVSLSRAVCRGKVSLESAQAQMKRWGQ